MAFRTLLEDARRGDRNAIEALLESQLGGLRAFIRLRSGNALRRRESQSDLVQTICRSVLENLEHAECADERSFRNWLYTVAHRRIINRIEFHRAQKRASAREVAFAPEDGNGHDAIPALETYDGSRTPSRCAEAREEVLRIEAAIDRLPKEYRDVLIGACIQNRSHEDIATSVGKSVLATRKILSRARAKLAIDLRGTTSAC